MPNRLLADAGTERVGDGDLCGPESLAVSSWGGTPTLFTGLQDGRIVRLTHSSPGGRPQWETVARTGRMHSSGHCGDGGSTDTAGTEPTCGRPLGLRVAARGSILPSRPGVTGEVVLVVADAYYGLLCVLHPHGGASGTPEIVTLATRAAGDPSGHTFSLLNDVVQAPDGTLYFTETTQEYQRRRIFYAFFSGRPTGRLLSWREGEGARVVADGIFMANGVTLSIDGTHLLIVSGVSVLKYSLARGEMEPAPLVAALPGSGDNIRTTWHTPSEGSADTPTPCYLAGLGSRYSQPFSLMHAAGDWPWVRQLMASMLPYASIVNAIPKYGILAVIAANGTILETFQDPSGKWPWLSEGEYFDGFLYLGSWYVPARMSFLSNESRAGADS